MTDIEFTKARYPLATAIHDMHWYIYTDPSLRIPRFIRLGRGCVVREPNPPDRNGRPIGLACSEAEAWADAVRTIQWYELNGLRLP